MKARVIGFVVAAVLCAPAAWAQERETVEGIANETGLSTRQVQMVLGCHSSFAEYRTGFKRAKDQLVAKIGQERYEELAAAYRAGEIADGRGS
jgi:hypothetical protein